MRQNAENELQTLKKTSAAEISALKEHAKQFQEQDTALAGTFGSKYASLKKEKDDLNLKFGRCRAQGRWYWLLAMCYMGNKPSEADVCIQYGTFLGSKPKDAGSQTAGSSGVGVRAGGGRVVPGGGYYAAVAEFQGFWQQILKEALEVSVECMWSIEWRSPVQLLLETISTFYSKKILMDLIDDREHRPRQHLGFFIYDFYISQNKTAAEGSKAFLKFIANIVQYLPRPESVEHLHSLHSPVSDGVSIGPGSPRAMSTMGEDNACVVDGSLVLKGSAVNRAKQNGRERYNSRLQVQQDASIFRDSYLSGNLIQN